MKKLNLLCISVVFFNYTCSIAQDTKSINPKKIKLQNLSFIDQNLTETIRLGSLDEFKNLGYNANNDILKPDFSTYNQATISHSSTKLYSYLCGFQIYNKKKKAYNENFTLRLGLNFTNSNNLFNHYSNTFIYNANSNDSDTTIFESITMENKSKKLQIDGALLYNLKLNKRFTIQTGLGITSGISYNNRTTITRYDFITEDETTYNYHYLTPLWYNYSYVARNKPSVVASTYIPLGINFQIGKAGTFLGQWSIFLEARPTLKVMTLADIKPITNAFISYGYGVKISVN